MRRAVFLVAAAGAAAAAAVAADRYARGWGVDPAEAAAELPGDDLVPGATKVMTHGITIEAAPADVWPWLVQMGFGRAGWYSYDVVDMRGRSHATLAPELQSLAVGDVLPTHPGGGFVVRHLDPERALVVYVDTEIAAGWSASEGPRGGGERRDGEGTPANLRATGALIGGSGLDEFRASWAWVLRDLGDGRTRLVERFRVQVDGEPSPAARVGLPLLGYGVFVMLRRQMIGIRERAEASARERLFAAAEASAESTAAAAASEEGGVPVPA